MADISLYSDVFEKYREKFDVSSEVLPSEVCLLTPRRRAFARNVEFPLYFPRTSISINQVLLLILTVMQQTMETTSIGTINGR